MRFSALAIKRPSRRSRLILMQQITPQLHLALALRPDLPPEEREKLIALLAALLLGVAESEAVHEQ
jgi:hypothetical protein